MGTGTIGTSDVSDIEVHCGLLDGTFMIKDIFAGSFGSGPSFFSSIGDFLIFTASDENSDVEPWVSDGTMIRTQRLLDIHTTGNSIPLGYLNYDGSAFFVADDGSVGRELWKSDVESVQFICSRRLLALLCQRRKQWPRTLELPAACPTELGLLLLSSNSIGFAGQGRQDQLVESWIAQGRPQ